MKNDTNRKGKRQGEHGERSRATLTMKRVKTGPITTAARITKTTATTTFQGHAISTMKHDTNTKDKRQGEHEKRSTATLTMKRVKIGPITTAVRVTKTPAAAPTEDWTKIPLPRAESWQQGMKIANYKGQPLFMIAKNENLGTELDPEFRLFLADHDGANILAVVTQLGTDIWEIYTCFPSFDGQKPAIRLLGTGKYMFLFGKFCGKSTFKREVDRRSENQTESVMKAEITRRCCCKSPLHATFFKPNQLDPVISRDQKEESVVVAPGENLLLSVCLSYIVDRMARRAS